MKIDKFTKVCINIVLILLIALLLKFLITNPRDLYAKSGVEYTWAQFQAKTKDVGVELNKYAKEGWRLHTILSLDIGGGYPWFIFIYER